LQKIKVRQEKREWGKIDLRDDEVDGHFFPERRKIDDLKNCWEGFRWSSWAFRTTPPPGRLV